MSFALILGVAAMPNLISILVPVIFLLAAFAIVWWAINSLNLPQPIRIVAIVVMALCGLLALLWVAQQFHI